MQRSRTAMNEMTAYRRRNNDSLKKALKYFFGERPGAQFVGTNSVFGHTDCSNGELSLLRTQNALSRNDRPHVIVKREAAGRQHTELAHGTTRVR